MRVCMNCGYESEEKFEKCPKCGSTDLHDTGKLLPEYKRATVTLRVLERLAEDVGWEKGRYWFGKMRNELERELWE